jgi:hypothetical protein
MNEYDQRNIELGAYFNNAQIYWNFDFTQCDSEILGIALYQHLVADDCHYRGMEKRFEKTFGPAIDKEKVGMIDKIRQHIANKRRKIKWFF